VLEYSLLGCFGQFSRLFCKLFLSSFIMSLAHRYGLSVVSVAAYCPFWTKFVDRFEPPSSARLSTSKVDGVPVHLLTDANMSIFIEEQWAAGMSEGSYKKMRAALSAAWAGEGLGSLDWQDSAKFPRCWILCKV